MVTLPFPKLIADKPVSEENTLKSADILRKVQNYL